MSTKVMAIDQSLKSSAVAILSEVSDTQLEIYHTDVPNHKKCSGIYRLADIEKWLNDELDKHKPDVLVREQHTMRQFGAASQLQAVGGIIDLIAYHRNYVRDSRYVIIGPGTWKKICLGKGNLKKDTAYMMYMNRFFKQTEWLKKQSEISMTDDNLADAICLGITGWHAYRLKNGKDVPDVVREALSGVIDNIFAHGSA